MDDRRIWIEVSVVEARARKLLHIERIGSGPNACPSLRSFRRVRLDVGRYAVALGNGACRVPHGEARYLLCDRQAFEFVAVENLCRRPAVEVRGQEPGEI